MVEKVEKKKEVAKGIIRKEFTQSLKVALTQKEILEAGETMADSQRELSQAEGELTSIKAQFKSRIEAADVKIKLNANLIRDKFEFRPVKCERVLDFKKEVVSEIRLDSGETVHSRPMKESEKQMTMEGIDLS